MKQQINSHHKTHHFTTFTPRKLDSLKASELTCETVLESSNTEIYFPITLITF